MDPVLERARWWSWRRQRLDRSCRGVEDCLRSVIGVPSSNPQGPLALLARVPRLMKGAAVEGVIGTRRAVRIPAMRRSIFMVPTDHAGRILAATRLSDAPYRRLLERKGIGPKAYQTLKERVLAVATEPLSLEQIRGALTRPPRALDEALRFMCAEGDMLRVRSRSVRANELTYAATIAWLKQPLPEHDPTESLAWLADAYLSAFGPARVEDFAWWTGQPEAAARAALLAHEPVDLGDGLLLHERDRRAFDGLRPMTGRVNLLPKWDCYTMGYAPDGRARFVDPKHQDLVYDAGGNAQPVVLIEGRVRGTWRLRLTPTRARIVLELFARPDARLRDRLVEEARMIGAFFDAKTTAVDVERTAATRAGKR